MDKREIARRTSEARRLLDEPLLNEAIDKMEHHAVEELLRTCTPDNDVTAMMAAASHVRTIRGLRNHLELTIVSGEAALTPQRRVA
jgi:hypothetical protein